MHLCISSLKFDGRGWGPSFWEKNSETPTKMLWNKEKTLQNTFCKIFALNRCSGNSAVNSLQNAFCTVFALNRCSGNSPVNPLQNAFCKIFALNRCSGNSPVQSWQNAFCKVFGLNWCSGNSRVKSLQNEMANLILMLSAYFSTKWIVRICPKWTQQFVSTQPRWHLVDNRRWMLEQKHAIWYLWMKHFVEKWGWNIGILQWWLHSLYKMGNPDPTPQMSTGIIKPRRH